MVILVKTINQLSKINLTDKFIKFINFKLQKALYITFILPIHKLKKNINNTNKMLT